MNSNKNIIYIKKAHLIETPKMKPKIESNFNNKINQENNSENILIRKISKTPNKYDIFKDNSKKFI